MTNAELIERARNPRRHGEDPHNCPACFGPCAAWPGDWVEDAEDLAAEMASALEREEALKENWRNDSSEETEARIVLAERLFARIAALPKKGNTYQVHVADLLEIMAEHGVTE